MSEQYYDWTTIVEKLEKQNAVLEEHLSRVESEQIKQDKHIIALLKLVEVYRKMFKDSDVTHDVRLAFKGANYYDQCMEAEREYERRIKDNG